MGIDNGAAQASPPVTSRQIGRALARAHRGVAIDVDECHALLAARDEQLLELQQIAQQVRSAAGRTSGLPGVVTYSPKVFIPLTRLCRDRCHYCTFVASPGKLRAAGEGLYLEPAEVLAIARAGQAAGCLEALFTLGDRPEHRWPAAADWLNERGYDSTLAYVRAMAILVLEETGLLPHLNPGVMTWEEMARLRPVAASMGLMLESSSRRLFETPGLAHYGSPDKDPAVRLRVFEDAGRQSIPFTTGLLLGIGETPPETASALLELRRLAISYGHIQEVIIQNFRAKQGTAMATHRDLDVEPYLAAVATARVVLPPSVRVQAPPNLTDRGELAALLASGLDDWGGVSPVTPDHVNPERPWPEIDLLSEVCSEAGLQLRARLAAHPRYVGGEWIDVRVRRHVEALRDGSNLAQFAVKARGIPWQAPADYQDFAAQSAGGRTDLNEAIDISGRHDDRRGDFAEVYGDWHQLAATLPSAGSSVDSDFRDAMSLAVRDPAALADPQHEQHALRLMAASEEELIPLAQLADAVRADSVGEAVTYVVNRNLNFTNVCYTGCRFCAFAQRKTDVDAFTLTDDQIADRVREAWLAGATEICMQGGIHPDLPGTAYFDLARIVKSACPQIHLHAFSPMEVINGAARADMSIQEWLLAAKDAGVDSIPGTAAEILDDEIRWVLTKGKLPAAQWIEVVSTAHRVGLPSSSTMMYGHVDAPIHWVRHLRTLREIQLQTGGFTEFVGLPFVHHNAPIYLAGLARPGSTRREDIAVTAMSRLMLHGAINNIQVSWVKLGAQGCAELLQAGANDVGGTLMEETISRMAGSEFGSAMSVGQLVEIASSVGRPTRERSTVYGPAPTRLALTK